MPVPRPGGALIVRQSPSLRRSFFLNYDIDLLCATSLTKDQRRAIARVRECALGLHAAKLRGHVVFAIGDDGGQTYFTVPANAVAAGPRGLAQLLFDVDHLHWANAEGVELYFDSRDSAIGGGGTGGCEVVDGVWVHDVFKGSMLAERIRAVLAGDRPELWPHGADPAGKPNRAEDMVDLIAEEAGDGQIFDLMRRAQERVRAEGAPALTRRFANELTRLLDASSARNRIQAATILIDRADPEALVRAVREGASGRASVPPWGKWERFAVVVLGDLMRRGEAAAWAAFRELALEPHWIEHRGQWLFVDWTEFEQRLTDPDVFLAELRTLPGRKRVPSMKRAALPAG